MTVSKRSTPIWDCSPVRPGAFPAPGAGMDLGQSRQKRHRVVLLHFDEIGWPVGTGAAG